MPRNVRNYWLTATADGQASAIGIGPRGATGGLHAILNWRDCGAVSPKRIIIDGIASPSGDLVLHVTLDDGEATQLLWQGKSMR